MAYVNVKPLVFGKVEGWKIHFSSSKLAQIVFLGVSEDSWPLTTTDDPEEIVQKMILPQISWDAPARGLVCLTTELIRDNVKQSLLFCEI